MRHRFQKKSHHRAIRCLCVCLCAGAAGALSLIAQSGAYPRSSVTPEQVDENYDPLRNRQVNPIRMIRDIRRKDAPTDPTQVDKDAEVTVLPPRRQETAPRPQTPPPRQSVTPRESVTPRSAPTTRPQTTPRTTPPPAPRQKPLQQPEAEDAPRVATTPAPEAPLPEESLPLPPPPQSPSPAQPASGTALVVVEEEIDPALAAELPQNAVANRIDVSKNPGFIAFDELPTGEYLDEEDYKDYFDAGWSILVQSQVEVVEDIASLRKNIDDRDNYLTTGMAMLAQQQDENTTRLNEMESRLAELESARAPAQDENVYTLTPLEEEDPLMQEGEVTEETTTTVTTTTRGPGEADEEEEVYSEREAELDYLITLLDDIIANTNKYLFWTGYLPEAGPTPLRFAQAEFVVDRRDLIPLTTPITEGVDADELFASSDEDELIDTGKSSREKTKRPAYEGNLRELTRDQVLQHLRDNAGAAQDVRVHFQIPNQTRARPLDTPNSGRLYSTE